MSNLNNECSTYIVNSQETCAYPEKCIECGNCIAHIFNAVPSGTSMIKLGNGIFFNKHEDGSIFTYSVSALSEGVLKILKKN